MPVTYDPLLAAFYYLRVYTPPPNMRAGRLALLRACQEICGWEAMPWVQPAIADHLWEYVREDADRLRLALLAAPSLAGWLQPETCLRAPEDWPKGIRLEWDVSPYEVGNALVLYDQTGEPQSIARNAPSPGVSRLIAWCAGLPMTVPLADMQVTINELEKSAAFAVWASEIDFDQLRRYPGTYGGTTLDERLAMRDMLYDQPWRATKAMVDLLVRPTQAERYWGYPKLFAELPKRSTQRPLPDYTVIRPG